MREAQEYHTMQMLLLMQRISHPATTTLKKDRLINIKCLLQSRVDTFVSHSLVGQGFEQKTSTRYIFSRLLETCFLFIIKHPAADSCSWVCPVFTWLNPSIIRQSTRLHSAHKLIYVLIHFYYFHVCPSRLNPSTVLLRHHSQWTLHMPSL